MKPIESIFLPKTKWYCNRRFEKALLIATDVISMALAFAIAALIAAPFHRISSFSHDAWASAFETARAQIYLMLIVLSIGVFWGKGH